MQSRRPSLSAARPAQPREQEDYIPIVDVRTTSERQTACLRGDIPTIRHIASKFASKPLNVAYEYPSLGDESKEPGYCHGKLYPNCIAFILESGPIIKLVPRPGGRVKRVEAIQIGVASRGTFVEIISTNLQLPRCIILANLSLPQIHSHLYLRHQYASFARSLTYEQRESLGAGSYANVYVGTNTAHNASVAIKYAKIKPEAISTVNCSSWHELYILRKIITPILEARVSPNLPFLISYGTVNRELRFGESKEVCDCLALKLELANGTLANFLRGNPSIAELEVCLFQLLAGVHAYQKHGHVMNHDVKAENVLTYIIPAGGYWRYVIMGREFLVPNLGRLFVINDFGTSRSMAPQHILFKSDKDITYRLGMRYAIVRNGKFWPLSFTNQYTSQQSEVKSTPVTWSVEAIRTSATPVHEAPSTECTTERKSKGAEVRTGADGQILPLKGGPTKAQVKYLENMGKPIDPNMLEFYSDSMVIPPMEFYNDTQDVFRMFLGGKRTTQKGTHRRYPLDAEFIEQITDYEYPIENSYENEFPVEARYTLAGYAILSLFVHSFGVKRAVDVIETFRD